MYRNTNLYTFYDVNSYITYRVDNTEKHRLPPNFRAKVSGGMSDYIGYLKKKRPHWEFCCATLPWRLDNDLFLRRFDVYEGEEVIGSIWEERHWRGHIEFHYTNSRVDKAMQRVRSGFSREPKTAAKKALPFFYPLDPREKYDKRSSPLLAEIRNKLFNPQREASNLTSKLTPFAVPYFVENWEKVRLRVTDPGLQAVDAPDVFRRAKEAERSSNQVDSNSLVIHKVGDNYLIAENDIPRLCSITELPPIAVERMAMLRLAPPDQFITDIGYRKVIDGEDSYCVLL